MKISKLSNFELEASFTKCVANERKVLHWIIEHIKEIDARRLYAERGYDSMLSYLVKFHGYSNTAAERRLYAARLARDVPDLLQKVESGTMNLSQICQVSTMVKQKEKDLNGTLEAPLKRKLVELVEGKSNLETQVTLSRELNLPFRPAEQVVGQKDESVNLQITLSKGQYELLGKCKALGFHLLQKQRDHSLAGTIEMICQQFLKARGVDGIYEGPNSSISMRSENATITPKTRRLILQRDRCCQFVDRKTGLICESRVGLQVDHIIPRWAGGDNSESNLRALCGTHNRLEYRKQASLRLN